MPYIKIETNADVKDSSGLLKKLSSTAAKGIGKPESYVMTSFSPVQEMTFGGSSDDAVFIECKSIGLSQDMTKDLSAILCNFCKDELNVPENRVYIEFSNAEGAMWGWDGRTF